MAAAAATLRRFPTDQVANMAATIPFMRNGSFGSFGVVKEKVKDLSFAGLLVIRWRNWASGKDDGGDFNLPNVWDEEEIGCGGYGVVWVVRDPRTGRRVALKKMTNVFQSPGHTKRAFRELKLLCSLKHENVLTCCDILEPSDPTGFKDIFVVTELMETDLQRIIVSSQSLTSDHIKMFMYQILRGMKYLHSANVLHRDLKPSNLLVNSNCFLKICDFGLARIWEGRNDDGLALTPEVVTEYYRSPELLMGSTKYNEAADVWSIGCIFAELLARRILFLANSPLEQLSKIVDLLGTPTRPQMKYACDAAQNHILRSRYSPPNLARLFSLSSQATTDAVDLLVHLLKFDPDERISVEDALEYPYVQEARQLYHSCMCTCCMTSDRTRFHNLLILSQLRLTLEPKHNKPMDVVWEKELNKLTPQEMRRRIYDFIMDRSPLFGSVLALNQESVSYEKFMAATVVEQQTD